MSQVPSTAFNRCRLSNWRGRNGLLGKFLGFPDVRDSRLIDRQ